MANNREASMKKFREAISASVKPEKLDKVVECCGDFYDESLFADDLSDTYDDVSSAIKGVDPDADTDVITNAFFKSVKG